MNYFTAFLFTLAFIHIAAADTNELDALSLDQAFALAERLHPELSEADALVDAAKGRAKQAGAFPNPEAIARLEATTVSDQAEYFAGASQPLPLGRKLTKARQAEQLEANRLSHQRAAKQIELRGRVHSAFATALYQENTYQAQKALADDATKLVTIVKARAEAGDATKPDLARAELDSERANIELQRAASLREQALLALAATIGNSCLTIRSLTGNLESVWELPSIEELAKDLQNHPALVAHDDAIKGQRARLDLSKAQRIPDVRVELLYHRLENENRNTVDVGFAIPLPLFDRNRGRIQEAQSELQAAEARARASQNELTHRLRAAYATLTTALSTGQAFKSNILPRSEALLKNAEHRYALGDITLSELLALRRESSATKLAALELSRGIMQAWIELRSLASK